MNDHIDDIVIHPLKTKKDKALPPDGLFLVNPGEAHKAMADLTGRGGKELFLHNSRLALTGDGTRFVAGPAIGAPAAALVMEKLIVLGARRIILMGWCGAIAPHLSIGDIIIPHGAVCGEGTSPYYSGKKVAVPSEECRSMLQDLLDGEALQWKNGILWSTDAPYRESRSHMQQLARQHEVVAVDMEFSALCSVASFRRVEFAAALVVSDEVGGRTWRPGFKDELFQDRRQRLLQILLP